jgi:hypothetical protein
MAQIRWSLPVHDRGCHANDAASSGVACNEGLSQTFEARDALAESPVSPCHHLTRSVFINPVLNRLTHRVTAAQVTLRERLVVL